MAVGDGDGNLPTPSSSQKKLIREVWRGTPNKVVQDSKNQTRLLLSWSSLLMPVDSGCVKLGCLMTRER